MDELDARLHRIGQHPFHAKFRLRGRDRAVVDLCGITTVRRHAEELVGRRLAPAEPRNDGRQTPYRGHPVFVAQHATATCCRTCLARWHDIPAGHALDGAERSYVVEAICRWIAKQYAPTPRRRDQIEAPPPANAPRVAGERPAPPSSWPGAAMRRIATIGVYGFTAGAFVEKLTGGGVGLLLDLRQRRGVRGPDYSWANSVRLQRALAAADIGYRHVKELAPTTELRQLQYREDDCQGVGKRNRIALAPEYAERYTREILDPFDLGALVAELPSDSVTALFCVERDPEACHRSLVAARLRAEYGLPVTDLRPG